MEFSFLAFVMTVPTASRFSRYAAVFLRWFLIGLTVFAVTAWLGFYIRDNVLPKVYIARAQIQVPSIDLTTPVGGANPTSAPLQPVYENTIRAPDFLLTIIKNLNLETTWENHVEAAAQDQVPDVDALTRLGNMLRLHADANTDIVSIGVASADPKEAAAIANALANEYKTVRDATQATSTPVNSPGQQSLLDQIDKQRKLVDDEKAEVEKIQQELDGPTTPPYTTRDQSRLGELQADLRDSQADYDARKALVAKTDGVSDEEFIKDLTNAGKDADDFNSQLAILQAKTPPDQTQISDLIARYRRAMKINLDMAKARVSLLQKDVDSHVARMEEQSPALRQSVSDLAKQQAILDALILRSKQVMSDEVVPSSSVRILTRAEPPTEPTHPNKELCFIVTMVGASILALLAASFAEVVLLLMRASARTDN